MKLPRLLSAQDIKRLHLADVTLPAGTPLAGQTCPIYAFLVAHPQGAVLVDTGLGPEHPGIDEIYRPLRHSLIEALVAFNLTPTDVVAVVNTHLHFDHCGGNQVFPGTPIYVQAEEYRATREPLYTVPDWVDFPGARFELLDGEAEVLPDVSVVPTPGHTPGHQSVVVETEDGRVILAGQAAYTADEFVRPEAGHVWGRDAAWDRDQYLDSLRRLHALGPRRVYFSHDAAVWEPGTASGR